MASAVTLARIIIFLFLKIVSRGFTFAKVATVSDENAVRQNGDADALDRIKVGGAQILT